MWSSLILNCITGPSSLLIVTAGDVLKLFQIQLEDFVHCVLVLRYKCEWQHFQVEQFLEKPTYANSACYYLGISGQHWRYRHFTKLGVFYELHDMKLGDSCPNTLSLIPTLCFIILYTRTFLAIYLIINYLHLTYTP